MKKTNQSTNLALPKTYLSYFLINGLVVYLANTLFPQHIVLGTQYITPTWAIIHSMGTLALINTLIFPTIKDCKIKKGKPLTTKKLMIKYLAINFLSVWFIARFARQLGMGISSWLVALTLALVLSIFQKACMVCLKKNKK